MERRNFIATTVLGGLAVTACKPSLKNTPEKKRALRIVHVTDMHIFDGPVPELGISNLINEIKNMEDQPDFVLNTGDNIMDALKRSKEEVAAQWEAWKNNFRQNIDLPLYNCIGNHDVWGWSNDDPTIQSDELYGKNWALKMLELENRYYTFEKNGWKIICLDSPYYDKDNHGYIAKLDEEQFEWLKTTLDNTPATTNILIASHIPILSPSTFFDGDNEKTGNWVVPGAWMHIDARRIKDLLKNYTNVKLAASGHIHLVDQAKYLDINYVCNGAACGAWWKGNYQEFAPAYALIDLYEDGSFGNQLVYYNWK